MKKNLALYLIILYSILAYPFSALQAEESFADHYNISYITMNDGLPHNFIDDIYKDSYGFLWISMQGGGLSRYDGYSFINFTPSTHCRLKSNFISNVYEDNFKRLWIASEAGIDIIDLTVQQSVPLLESAKNIPDIAHQPAYYITRDALGCIWILGETQLHRISFDEAGNINQLNSLDFPFSLRSHTIIRDVEGDGKIWAGINGQLCKIGFNVRDELQATPITETLALAPDLIFTDFIIKEEDIWIATDQGLYRYNKKGDIVKHYEHNPGDPHSLSQNYLTSLAMTNEKQLIIASLKGINIYNPITDNFERIDEQASHKGTRLLNSDFINCINIEGKHIWIGTESGGINKLTTKRLSVQNYLNDKENSNSISPNPVNSIYEDENGALWVGTVEGGLNRKEPGSNHFTHYTHENGILSHNTVSAITADPQGRLWVGTWGGGITLLDLNHPNRMLKNITTADKETSFIYFIGALIYDPINNGMWIGARDGIYFYDFARQKIVSPLPKQVNANIHGCIGTIIDREGKLWMGCLEGVYIIDLHKRDQSSADGTFAYRHLKYKLDAPNSGLIEKITCFYETHNGTLWLGSNGYGIYKRSTDANGKEVFTAYTTTHGLADNCIRSILEDDKGQLWIATYNGLSRLQSSKERFISYTEQDDLLNGQFYWNAACRSARGELYFGHMAGLSVIESDLPTVPLQPSQMRFTQLTVSNERVLPGTEQLPQAISITQELKIHESKKSFLLEFSPLNFESNNMGTYSYRLIGFDRKWMKVPHDQHFLSYTNLSPGTYNLQVKYSPNDEEEEEKIAELKIIIQPYFYKTIWFALLVIAFISVAIWQFYQWRIRNFKQQQVILHNKVEQRTHELNEQKQILERQTEELSRQNLMLKEQNEKITQQKIQLTEMARKVQELTLDKIAFFTNITHEFRTPITLIIGPIERALKLSYNPQVIEQLHFVERNSKYLLSLVNQLMDFRKVESGKLEIIKSRHNFLKFINELITPFQVFARERNIELKLYCRISTPEMSYDEEAMHKVFTNLLSNAIKFTPNGGSVSLYIAQFPPTADRQMTLYICVSDTGCGIPAEDTERIFNRFYQSKGQTRYPMYGQASSGIGLYLCKRIVQMHGGDIYAGNNHTTGCSIRILLPMTDEEVHVDPSVVASLPDTQQPDAQPTAENEKKGLNILVVEDNADMRGYIRSILRDRYNVVEAADGAEALNILNSQPIDFIISDLMMPVMDGIELSRRVKENLAISHIPFLMLTAKTSQEARIESYRIGVDDYLLKPFDETLLLTRIENILENRKRYQRKFAMNMNVESLNIEEESGDKKFINRIMEIMKENYRNPGFEVAGFCEAAGVSKTLLNQKLQSLIGQSPAQFIRNYRLNLARDLILKSRGKKDISVAEIAYETGFNDPKYFTRCFTKEFNVKPSELLNKEE
ncbi:MAG: two-component regulator propeller domain-containing protein [Bacteroides sp.]|nr:two-component regulator propeller domain-containing protein [Bacteroides sp.]